MPSEVNLDWLEPLHVADDASFKCKSDSPVFLNIGCGNKPFMGFVNIDNRPALESKGILICDAGSLKMIEDESVDYIYACHVLEHIHRSKTLSVLKEWNRVLKVGGMIRLSVPDWDATVEYYNETKDLENVLNWIYGGRELEEKNEFTHKRIFNEANLRSLLYEVGFKRIEKYDHITTFHGNIDDFSAAYKPHMDMSGIHMSLNLQANK